MAIVAMWFIYQLKRRTKFVTWWENVLLNWWKAAMAVLPDCWVAVVDALSWLMKILISPLDKSDRGRHYLRNIYL